MSPSVGPTQFLLYGTPPRGRLLQHGADYSPPVNIIYAYVKVLCRYLFAVKKEAHNV
jgi:hypothetical protein